ncbi:hypothetical protein TNCT_530071 [Trichonephila clavata]|uniref:Uncharacterized protein n=1 Tax=Trichonephila clavata TaxID=2740835 RepID=A0A8X6JBT5_TRICU|nr:hypothetical protein TNCT_530071 [Trichonephila clavata]
MSYKYFYKYRGLVRKIEETGCTYNRPGSIVFDEVVAEVHNTIIVDPLHTLRSDARSFDVQKITVLKLLCSVLGMFLYRFLRVQLLQLRDV